ncbi:DUF7620 family protein [Mycobacterium sp. LTG2003]
MKWPWQVTRRDVEEANQAAAEAVRRAKAADRQDQAAEFRRKASEQLRAQSLSVTARLRRETEKNGWTELLQHAMGGR